MNRIVASFLVDPSAWEQFRALCADVSETPDTALRDLIRKEIRRRKRGKARKSESPDERLLDRLRRLVADALTEARDWEGYRSALQARGLGLAPKGGGLVLFDLATRRELAKASAVGPGYLPLVRRFRAALPGHPHEARAEAVLSRPDTRVAADRGAAADDPDDIDLIEPF